MHGHCYSDVPFPEDMRTSILKWAKGLKASDFLWTIWITIHKLWTVFAKIAQILFHLRMAKLAFISLFTSFLPSFASFVPFGNSVHS